MKFRKKPVAIEAVQFTGSNWDELSEYFGDLEANCVWVDFDSLCIMTLEGDMIAQIGDWIIKGVQGEFYPCKPDIFEQTYELVSTNEKGRAVMSDNPFCVNHRNFIKADQSRYENYGCPHCHKELHRQTQDSLYFLLRSIENLHTYVTKLKNNLRDNER